jgi:hypothetical protein
MLHLNSNWDAEDTFIIAVKISKAIAKIDFIMIADDIIINIIKNRE